MAPPRQRPSKQKQDRKPKAKRASSKTKGPGPVSPRKSPPRKSPPRHSVPRQAPTAATPSPTHDNPSQAARAAQADPAPALPFIYGRHAVAALLANPAREIETVVVTRAGGKWLAEAGFRDQLIAAGAREMPADELGALLAPGCVHQGVAVLAKPLPALDLADLVEAPGTGPVIILDQITDPQNIGAILRSAAAFDAKAVILQARHSPAITGALAKAAAGAVETVPIIRVVNIARTLDELKSNAYFCVGLAGAGSTALGDVPPFDNVALVMGAEGDGLRPLVARACDVLATIPISAAMESLNVSAAAAIALYALKSPKPDPLASGPPS